VLLAIYRIQQRLLHTEDDKRLARLFLPDLLAVIVEQKPRRVLTQLRGLLRDVTGYPVPAVEDYPLSDRKKLMEDWWKGIPKGEE
jgi:hypothetical protein